MKKVLFKAPALTFSGYGVHSRQVAKFLIEKANAKKIDLYIELTQWGQTPWALDDKLFNGFAKEVMKYRRRHVDAEGKQQPVDVSIQLLLPNEWDPALAKYNVGMSACVESDRCNPAWAEACNKMDLVVVPSQHTLKTLRASGDVKPPDGIHVIPESYIEALDGQPADVDFGFKTPFNYLVLGQFTSAHPLLDRKNILSTLKVLCETHKGDKEVGIIVKTNSGRGTKLDRKTTRDRLKNLLKDARQGEFPKVYLVHGDMTDAEMVALYYHPSIKALVTLTRGEGYGLPILEAAVAGIPVIATDWSGYLDFMNKGEFIKIGYQLEPIPVQRVDKNIWIEGSRWAIPRESHVKKALKKFRTSSDIPKQWALELSEKLRREYCYAAVRDMYEALLGPMLGV